MPQIKRREDKLDRLIGQVNVSVDAVGKFDPQRQDHYQADYLCASSLNNIIKMQYNPRQ